MTLGAVVLCMCVLRFYVRIFALSNVLLPVWLYILFYFHTSECTFAFLSKFKFCDTEKSYVAVSPVTNEL